MPGVRASIHLFVKFSSWWCETRTKRFCRKPQGYLIDLPGSLFTALGFICVYCAEECYPGGLIKTSWIVSATWLMCNLRIVNIQCASGAFCTFSALWILAVFCIFSVSWILGVFWSFHPFLCSHANVQLTLSCLITYLCLTHLRSFIYASIFLCYWAEFPAVLSRIEFSQTTQ